VYTEDCGCYAVEQGVAHVETCTNAVLKSIRIVCNGLCEERRDSPSSEAECGCREILDGGI
jgi:hypothetical protein